MSSEYTPSSDRRPRRGGRSSGGRRQGGPRQNRQETSAPVQPKKKSLWQKITAFFTGEPAQTAPKSNGHRPPTRPTGKPADRPARAEHSSQGDRPGRSERPSGFRKPELVEVTSPRIYVGNLSFDATESDLSELFSGVGTVDTVEVVANKYTHKSKGFAFVQMQSVDEAKRAVSELHDKEYMGRKLVVSGAKAAEERRTARAEAVTEATAEDASEAATPVHQPEQ